MTDRRVLYSHPGCPFAHRTRALLNHLEVDFELRDTSLIFKDREFMRLSPTGKVPMWVEADGSVLFESAIIAEYLGESVGFAGWSEDAPTRARQRLAVQQFDAVIVPLLFYRPVRMWPLRWLRARERRAIDGELDLLESLVESTPTRSHLGLMLAPFWVRFRLISFMIGAEATMRSRPRLAAWLDEAAQLPEVQVTMADKAAYAMRYRSMRRAAMVTYSVCAAAAVAVAVAVIVSALALW